MLVALVFLAQSEPRAREAENPHLAIEALRAVLIEEVGLGVSILVPLPVW
ncbi:hypothetical protein [Nocardia sp. R6R-6]